MYFGIFAQEMIDISFRVTFGKPPMKIKARKRQKLSHLEKIQRIKLRVLEKKVDDILEKRREKHNKRNLIKENLQGVICHYPEMKKLKQQEVKLKSNYKRRVIRTRAKKKFKKRRNDAEFKYEAKFVLY
jgi:hypothetical protein